MVVDPVTVWLIIVLEILLDLQQLQRQQELLLPQLIPPLEQVEQMLICLLITLFAT